jgi:hypothetical protein
MSERACWYENSEYDVSESNSLHWSDTDIYIQSTSTAEEKAIEISEGASEKEAGESGEWKSGIAGRGRIHSVSVHRLSAHCDECSTRSDPPFAYIFFHFWFFSILLRHYKALFPVPDIPTCFFSRRKKGSQFFHLNPDPCQILTKVAVSPSDASSRCRLSHPRHSHSPHRQHPHPTTRRPLRPTSLSSQTPVEMGCLQPVFLHICLFVCYA